MGGLLARGLCPARSLSSKVLALNLLAMGTRPPALREFVKKNKKLQSLCEAFGEFQCIPALPRADRQV